MVKICKRSMKAIMRSSVLMLKKASCSILENATLLVISSFN